MRNACDSYSRCGLACDASTCDAKSLAMWVERCEPLSSLPMHEVTWGTTGFLGYAAYYIWLDPTMGSACSVILFIMYVLAASWVRRPSTTKIMQDAIFQENNSQTVFPCTSLNSVQARRVVKGEAQKSPLFWRFSGGWLLENFEI